jgi:hypothetical protein
MFERSSVQFIPILRPQWHELIHQRSEPVVVVPFQQVDKFVGDYVLQTVNRLLDEFQVQPDALGFDVTSSPLSFHPLHVPCSRLDADDPFPLLQQLWDHLLQPASISVIQQSLTSRIITSQAFAIDIPFMPMEYQYVTPQKVPKDTTAGT